MSQRSAAGAADIAKGHRDHARAGRRMVRRAEHSGQAAIGQGDDRQLSARRGTASTSSSRSARTSSRCASTRTGKSVNWDFHDGTRSNCIADVRAAAERLAASRIGRRSFSSRTLDERCGAHVFVKCENLQRMGAFKFRGAYNFLASLNARRTQARGRGVLERQPRARRGAGRAAARDSGDDRDAAPTRRRSSSPRRATTARRSCSTIAQRRPRGDRADDRGRARRDGRAAVRRSARSSRARERRHSSCSRTWNARCDRHAGRRRRPDERERDRRARGRSVDRDLRRRAAKPATTSRNRWRGANACRFRCRKRSPTACRRPRPASSRSRSYANTCGRRHRQRRRAARRDALRVRTHEARGRTERRRRARGAPARPHSGTPRQTRRRHHQRRQRRAGALRYRMSSAVTGVALNCQTPVGVWMFAFPWEVTSKREGRVTASNFVYGASIPSVSRSNRPCGT